MKAIDELKNIVDVIPQNMVLRITEKEIYDADGTLIETKPAITLSISGYPVDANGDRIERYNIQNYSETITVDDLKSNHPDELKALNKIKNYLLAKLKHREGLI